MSEKQVAQKVLSSTAGMSAQAVRLQLALLAGYDRNDIDRLARVLGASKRSVYRWLQEIDSSVTPNAGFRTPLESLARDAEEIANQAREIAASDLAEETPLPPHTPPTPKNLTSPPPIVPPRRQRRSSKFTAEEMAMVSAIVEECNVLWGKRFSPDAHANYIIRRIRKFPDVSLDEHLAIIRAATERPWWDGEPSPRVIYSRDDLFDSMRQSHGTAPRKTSSAQSREARQRELLGISNVTLEVSSDHSENRSSTGIALARPASDGG